MRPLRVAPLALCVTLTLSCGPKVNRDLTEIPQRQITYDDMCHLQSWFDQRAATRHRPYRALQEQSTETERTERDESGQLRHLMLGEGTYEVRDRRSRQRLQQLIREEYRSLPPMRLDGRESRVRVTLGWWGSGTIRRVRPDTDITVRVDDESYTLPPHPCVAEFLFGDEAYAMRRRVLHADSARARGEIPADYLDAGAEADGGAGGDAEADGGAAP